MVILTIGLLIAILLPVLRSARSQAYGIVCRSNLRQLVLANIGYSNENDGFCVPAASDLWLSVGPLHGGLHRWHGLRNSWNEPFDPLEGPLVSYLADGKVKECPERIGFVKDLDTSFEQGCGGYGYNMTYLGSRLWEDGIVTINAWKRAHAETSRILEISKPDRTLMFADTAFNQKGNLIEYSFAEPYFWIRKGKLQNTHPYPSIHFRHSGCANIGWSDGHVYSRQKANCKDSDAFNADFDRMKLGWFEPLDNSLFDLK
jgi:prepilin-type processing-associated H-X9-DG protein